MEVVVLRGDPQRWYGAGYGAGDGYGYGAGYGYGDGYGDGAGAGYGAGYGAGDGAGYGYGDGAGYGADLVRCIPVASVVTKDDLRANNACADQFRLFLKAFPDGCNWPADAAKARGIGLDMNWARSRLGLLFPVRS